MKTNKKFLSVFLAASMALSFAVSLTACSSEPKYELSYARGIYNAVGDMPAAKSYKEGAEVTLAPSDTFTYSGYTFVGWSDGTETYEGGSTFTMPAHDVKLMAKWVYGDPDEGSITASSVGFEGDYFVFTGTVKNASKLFIYLINTNVAGSDENFVQAEISGNNFTARLPLTKLIEFDVASNIPFNLRYTANDGKVPVNIEQGSLDITATYTYGGKNFRIGVNNKCVAVYYAAAPVDPDPIEPDQPDYTFSVADMRFADGKFIIEGSCGADVEKLIFHLHNTNAPVINFTSAAVIENGKFKAEFVLSEIKREDGTEPPASYINVRYELNDDGYKSLNLLPATNGSYTVGQEYRYGEKTWTLKADANRTYLNWSAITDKYRITEVKLELVEGKPTLKIAGTTTEAIEAANLKLLLDKTTGTTEKKYIENSLAEAGKFSFTVDLSGLIASANESAANNQQAYFIRLYNGETSIANINSRWASDLLWERGQIETEDAVYFLMKNTEWSNTAWNTLGICKFDK